MTRVGWILSAVQSEEDVQRLFPFPEWMDEFALDPVFVIGPSAWPEFILITRSRSRRRTGETVRISATMYYPPESVPTGGPGQ